MSINKLCLVATVLLVAVQPASGQELPPPRVAAVSADVLLIPLHTNVGQTSAFAALFDSDAEFATAGLGFSFRRAGTSITLQGSAGSIQDHPGAEDQIRSASVELGHELLPGIALVGALQAARVEWREDWSFGVPLGLIAHHAIALGQIHLTPQLTTGAAFRIDRQTPPEQSGVDRVKDLGLFALLGARAGLGRVWVEAQFGWESLVTQDPVELDGQSFDRTRRNSAALKLGFDLR